MIRNFVKVRAQVYHMMKGIDVVGYVVEVTEHFLSVDVNGTIYPCYKVGAQITNETIGNKF